MNTINDLIQNYTEAFDDKWPLYLTVTMKAYSIFCAALIGITIYAFIYRTVVGFDFY